LNAVSFKIYLCRSSIFTLIKTGTTDGVSNATDPVSSRRRVMSDEFLRHADREVSTLLNAYSLPVFVMGTKKPLQQFKGLTRCEQSISTYIYGKYLRGDVARIYKILQPYLARCENQQNRICYHDPGLKGD